MRFTLGSTLVTTDGQTRFRSGNCQNHLRNNERVSVKGRRQADGSVRATEVELDDDDDVVVGQGVFDRY
jgi:hypothetical protein